MGASGPQPLPYLKPQEIARLHRRAAKYRHRLDHRTGRPREKARRKYAATMQALYGPAWQQWGGT